jgi:hypothetical protein
VSRAKDYIILARERGIFSAALRRLTLTMMACPEERIVAGNIRNARFERRRPFALPVDVRRSFA